MKLTDFAEFSVPVIVHSEQCIHAFSPRSSCKKCIQVCPTRGLKLENGQLPIIDDCIGCGRCVHACSLNVFSVDFPKVMASNDEPLVLICRHNHIQDAPAFETQCLQQFDWLRLAQLLSKHQSVYLFSDKNICETCECQWFPIVQSTMLERNGFGYLLDRLYFIQSREEFEMLVRENQVSVNTRRQYLKNQLNTLNYNSKTYVKKTIDAYGRKMSQTVSQDDKLSFLKSQSSSMIAYSLWKEGTSELEADINFEKLVNTQCNFCRICEQLCPWEAIAIIEDDGRAVLAHHDVLCSRCSLCLDLCPTKGLFWDQGLKIQDMITPKWRILANAEEKECIKCGLKFFSTDSEQVRCSICENKL